MQCFQIPYCKVQNSSTSDANLIGNLSRISIVLMGMYSFSKLPCGHILPMLAQETTLYAQDFTANTLQSVNKLCGSFYLPNNAMIEFRGVIL